MTPTLPDIEFEKFTVLQRLELMGRIWDSIGANEFVVPESHKELIRQRIAQRKAHPGRDATWEEVKRDLQSESPGNVDH